MLALLTTAWRLAALAAELALAATHAKVLLCIGRPFSSGELAGKRFTYFLADAASPWNSLLAAAAPPAGSSSPCRLGSPPAAATAAAAPGLGLLPPLALLAVGHAALHAFYIATWGRAHAGNVVRMSAAPSMRSRWRSFNSAEVAWFLAGTSYDIAVHAALAGLLTWQLLAW